MARTILFCTFLFVSYDPLCRAFGEEAAAGAPGEMPEDVAGQAQPAQASPPAAAGRRRILDISIRGEVAEHETLPSIFGPQEKADLLSLYRLFQKARKDSSISGILLRLGPLDAGWGKCQELRGIIQEFRDSGKRVTVWLPLGTNREYFVASAADEIIMPPAGLLLTLGLRAEVTFFRGLLDKIGVEAEIVHVGEYKGAGEPYTRTDMSPQFRETIEAMLDDIMEAYVEGAARGRSITPEEFRQILDQGPSLAANAQQKKLIDRISYLEEFMAQLREKEQVDFITASRYSGTLQNRPDFGNPFAMLTIFSQVLAPPAVAKSGYPKLALIYAVGPILAEESPAPGFLGGDEIITANPIVKAFKEAREDPTVKAVVLRVNSPGGDVITSDLIWRAVEQTNQVKPVIVSMSDVAASGGYYISMPARGIVAYPTTITGSIGVLGGKLNLQKLFGLIGLNVEVVERGAGSGLFSTQHKLSEEEVARLYGLMKQTYDLFLEKAARGRNKPLEDMAKAAEGRAWTAKRAFGLGLVDELGGLGTAIQLAKKHAGLKPEDLLEPLILPRQPSLFELFFGPLEEARAASCAKLLSAAGIHPQLGDQVRLAMLLAERYVLVHMPWQVVIK